MNKNLKKIIVTYRYITCPKFNINENKVLNIFKILLNVSFLSICSRYLELKKKLCLSSFFRDFDKLKQVINELFLNSKGNFDIKYLSELIISNHIECFNFNIESKKKN